MADVIDALIAEALGEGPEGIAAVAHVIQQRALAEGKTPEQIVNEAGQFTGVTSPGRVVAQSMKDPATRAQVEQIWNGVQSGSIPNPYPGANYFHTPQVSPSWASEYQRLGQVGNHIFYSDGTPVATPTAPKRVEPSMPTMRPAENAVAAIDSAAPRQSSGGEWLAYANQNATRNQPLSDRLTGALSFLPDLGVTMEVFSGGQDAQGPNRVGSTRHDHGEAADVFFYKDGRRLDWANPDDLPIFEQIVRQGKAAGITGFGAGEGYMRPGSMHLGFGAPAVWGAGGSGANAPEWLRNAYNAGPMATPPGTMRAQAQAPKAGGFWGGITSPIASVMNMEIPQFPQVQPEQKQSIMSMAMGSLPVRTAFVRSLMNQNVGAAPSVSQGHSGGGTKAFAVSSKGRSPVSLMGMSAPDSGRGDGSNPSGMNKDIYRANAAVLSPGGFNQSSIDRALSSGKTLYKLA